MSLPHRKDLQGLRALSIGLVLLAHANIETFAGGFVGVDVFFVLSGYLITGLLLIEHEASGTIRLLAFSARRIRRLLPAMLAMILVTSTLAAFMFSRYEADEQLASLFYAGTWTSNLYFSFSTMDYFAELRDKDLFLHTWSLGVEEQFYLLWPALLLLCLTALHRIQLPATNRGNLLVLFSLLFAASLCLCLYWTAGKPLLGFYMMPSRIWQFSLGAIAFLLTYDQPASGPPPLRPGPNAHRYLRVLGLSMIVGSAVGLDGSVPYPGAWALIPSLGAALVIVAGSTPGTAAGSYLLSNRLAVSVGDRSYSWYLWHWPLFMLGFTAGVESALDTVMLLVVIGIFAEISFRYVEQPFWKGSFAHGPPGWVIIASAAAATCILGTSFLAIQAGAYHFTGQDKDHSALARSDIPPIYAYGCDSWYHNANVTPCELGDSQASRTAVIIGDSIGLQWFSIMPATFRRPDWRVVALTKSSCPMVNEPFFYKRIGQRYEVCEIWREQILQYVSRLKPEIIIVGSASTYGFSKARWIEGSSEILGRLAESTETVVVIPGTPSLSFDAPSCLDRSQRTLWRVLALRYQNCQEPYHDPEARAVSSYLAKAANSLERVFLLDLNDLVCPAGLCSAADPNGQLIFRDSQHLTNSFVQSTAPAIAERIKHIYGEGL